MTTENTSPLQPRADRMRGYLYDTDGKIAGVDLNVPRDYEWCVVHDGPMYLTSYEPYAPMRCARKGESVSRCERRTVTIRLAGTGGGE